ncbi:protein phosphatase inhibitor 2 isoform X1 [Brachypodium distachyon]|uniref:protein phosphatase inhibitor 2 isoform X1 n=1 Tax=Brachypodium distachyon TaxID=15368 RepID=UPI0001C742AD|nr:protein phosphatase inhibitor 2 isoform X1 [Brachypodium distachyon]XP_010235659.1 protein phosphatase inhibitor 2 isoform X1 [Brachypodium distachyon]|eukprot:XP_003575302.1 protein phosphatase inhibitor 2 isoform X1 [Brachypodium distachyon]
MKANESRKARGHVKWNEENLNDIESTKPVRQKIAEPKTPYHPMLDEHEGSVSPKRCIEESGDKSPPHVDAITSALMQAVSSGNFSARDSWESCGIEEQAINQGKDFEEHRKAHYDEFRKVQEHLQKGTLSGETDEYLNSEVSINKPSTS